MGRSRGCGDTLTPPTSRLPKTSKVQFLMMYQTEGNLILGVKFEARSCACPTRMMLPLSSNSRGYMCAHPPDITNFSICRRCTAVSPSKQEYIGQPTAVKGDLLQSLFMNCPSMSKCRRLFLFSISLWALFLTGSGACMGDLGNTTRL